MQNGPPNGGATLKNPATLIPSAPCRSVVDALKNERFMQLKLFTLFFFTHASPTLISSRPKIVGSTLKTFMTLIQFPPPRGVDDAYLQRRQLPTGK